MAKCLPPNRLQRLSQDLLEKYETHILEGPRCNCHFCHGPLDSTFAHASATQSSTVVGCFFFCNIASSCNPTCKLDHFLVAHTQSCRPDMQETAGHWVTLLFLPRRTSNHLVAISVTKSFIHFASHADKLLLHLTPPGKTIEDAIDWSHSRRGRELFIELMYLIRCKDECFGSGRDRLSRGLCPDIEWKHMWFHSCSPEAEDGFRCICNVKASWWTLATGRSSWYWQATQTALYYIILHWHLRYTRVTKLEPRPGQFKPWSLKSFFFRARQDEHTHIPFWFFLMWASQARSQALKLGFQSSP